MLSREIRLDLLSSLADMGYENTRKATSVELLKVVTDYLEHPDRELLVRAQFLIEVLDLIDTQLYK